MVEHGLSLSTISIIPKVGVWLKAAIISVQRSMGGVYVPSFQTKMLMVPPLISSLIQPLFWKQYMNNVISRPYGIPKRSGNPLITFEFNWAIYPMHLWIWQKMFALYWFKCSQNWPRKLQTRVYRKTTHTNEYLAFHFHHPMCHKKSITRTLLTGAEHLPSSYDSKEKEHQYVFSVLKDDDYPKTFLRNCCKPVTSLHYISVKEVLMAGLWLSCTFVAVQNP